MSVVAPSPGILEFAGAVREQFPILNQRINGRNLIYFDNAATNQKPQVVIDAISSYYETINSNVHRGVHHLSQLATKSAEDARKTVAAFINAQKPAEIVFTRGTTEAINLVSSILAQSTLGPDDEVLITEMEHHSNIVPWQLACETSGATLKVARVKDDGELDIDHLFSLLSDKTKVVALVHISNALGTINPIKKIVTRAKSMGALTLVDGAQALAHEVVDVQELGCDFYAFSGHKMYGPTGIGVLYGRYELLESLPPYHGGGEMIERVTFERTTYNKPPFKYEAGTPNIAGMIAMGTAITWVEKTGLARLAAYEKELLTYAERALRTIDGFIAVGTAPAKANIISFNLKDIHHYDLGVLLDKMGIALRTGHHCTQPLMDRFGISGTARVSLAPYNTFEEIDQLVVGIRKAQGMLLQ